MRYAIKYNYTPEELADQVTTICENIGPARGYNLNEYNGRPRLENIAAMVHALRENIRQHEKLQLADAEQVEAVSNILEWDNAHTENLAFRLAFGDDEQTLDALLTVHYMGQSFALENKLQHPITAS